MVSTRALTRISLGAVSLAAAFFVGFLIAHYSGGGFQAAFRVPMRGTAAAPQAAASLLIGRADRSGNRPAILRVSGLAPRPSAGYYELYLTRAHRPATWVSSFATHAGTTTVRLNVAYDLARFDGWVVAERLPGRAEPGKVLLASS